MIPSALPEPAASPEPSAAATATVLSRMLGRPYVFLDSGGHIGVAASGVAMPAHRFVALMLNEILAAAEISVDDAQATQAVAALFKQLRQPTSPNVPAQVATMLGQFVTEYAAAEAIGDPEGPGGARP